MEPSIRMPGFHTFGLLFLSVLLLIQYQPAAAKALEKRAGSGRTRAKLNDGWRFWRSEINPDGIIYDKRPDFSVKVNTTAKVLKPWVLPCANDFINDPANRHERPEGNPGSDVPYVQQSFDDKAWQSVNLPHDWAITGPFYTSDNPIVPGGMGRLPVHGIGWYRRKLTKSPADAGKSIYLEIDGAMSYTMVWLNGQFVGGWPYGYNSFRLDLTPYIRDGDDNQLAIRLDNPTDSARWYPGGGIYRSVWLTKVESTHVGQSGTFITSKDISAQSANLDLVVQVENTGKSSRQIEVVTDVHIFDSATERTGWKVSQFPRSKVDVKAGEKLAVNCSVKLDRPRLWGPIPQQTPNLYVAVTYLFSGGDIVDTYETRFGIRSLVFDSNKGLLVNGQRVALQGVNQHHDLGALGAAFNLRAAERQLEILQEMGCNSIRMSHNPPAAELLDLTDRMGFLVIDEIFDSWERSKTQSDFHLIFPEWHEPDLRAFLRRDRNHPSIISWSYGNEVGEQYTDEAGAALSRMLRDILHEEDATRPASASQNYASPDMPFTQVLDILNLNYQGAGIRNTPAYSFLPGIHTHPMYPDFHAKFPEKLILSTETASSLSTRGTYIFPVTEVNSAPVNDTSGGDSVGRKVSAYELYSSNFGSSPDKVFGSQDLNPYVAGEFVWSGFDYLGEPTPYYSSRSSFCGIVDLAGFKKDRFFIYQARWRPDLPMAHILPHWTWPDRVGKVTPVHVFSAGDEAELFVNEKSQGRIRRGEDEYRFRWDDVVYSPGEVRVVTYKGGKEWARETIRTASAPAQLHLSADRKAIKSDGIDLSFITVKVVDKQGNAVQNANNTISFSVSGPGEIVATDNGDPADMVAFQSKDRNAYSGLVLVIVRAQVGASKSIIVTASGSGLKDGQAVITPQ